MGKVAGNLNPDAPIRVLTRLHNPNIVTVILPTFVTFVVVLELVPIRIAEALFHVICDRQSIERILVLGLVVRFHIDKKSLFIRQMIVVLNFVVYAVWV